MTIHIVRPGDSLYTIAQQYDANFDLLMEINGLLDPNNLVVGQTILILTPQTQHIVQPGDTLAEIAANYGVSVNELYRNNPYLNARPDLIPGQTLVIQWQDSKLGNIYANGYAYPYINQELLRETLPFLSWISPFTYGITEDGNLLPLNDQIILSTAQIYGVAPLLHLSTLTPDGVFSSERATLILNDPGLTQNLISQIVQTIQSKNYAGIDIDFEFVSLQNRDAYTSFVREVREALAPLGYPVFVALAPKTSSEQKGSLYEGHDYGGLGAAADFVFLMTYEWGYTYGPPLAVAPLPSVRKVVEYALTQVPAEKIYLGIPNYGYDWKLPFQKGVSRAKLIGNQEAVEIARAQNAAISYSETDQAPFFSYYAQGAEHIVWFEDARSIKAKLNLVPEYGLTGVGYWNLMRPFPQNWQILNALFNIKQL